MSNATAANRGNLNVLADIFRAASLGDMLAANLIQHRRKFNAVASGTRPENLATLHVLELPNNAKAARVLRGTIRAGAITGEMVEELVFGVTPATTEVGVAPNGSIVFLAADAITDVDVVYIPERLDVVETTLPVVAATGVLAIPAPLIARGVVLLARAEVLTGGVTGRRIILVPGAVNPATGNARLSVAKDAIHFTVADAVTRARVTMLVTPKVPLHTFLETADQYI